MTVEQSMKDLARSHIKTCNGRIVYRFRVDAVGAIRALVGSRRFLVVFRCALCEGYHVERVKEEDG